MTMKKLLLLLFHYRYGTSSWKVGYDATYVSLLLFGLQFFQHKSNHAFSISIFSFYLSGVTLLGLLIRSFRFQDKIVCEN
jgi:hypothetical protein